MKFAIQVNSSPYHTEGAHTAYQFTKAALGQGHQIVRVFFYHDGVYNALATAKAPDDERQPVQDWSRLADKHGVDLVVCISAAQRRGLLLQEASAGPTAASELLAPGFRIAGLGLWVEACNLADRFIVF